MKIFTDPQWESLSNLYNINPIKNQKKDIDVVIMRGIPGSGKSSYIENDYHYTSHIVCSSDHYMLDEKGTYKFHYTKLKESHNKCFYKFLEECLAPKRPQTIIVDNTNTNALEVIPYVKICEALDISFEIVRLECHPQIAQTRQTHGVPTDTILRMYKQLQEPLPYGLSETIVWTNT